jgi:hypothetical protein
MRYNSRHLITVIIKNGRRPFLTGTAITTVLLHRHCCPLVSTQTQHSHQQCASDRPNKASLKNLILMVEWLQ